MQPWQNSLWSGTPPAVSSDPALYAGLLPRRCMAYLLDVVLIAIVGFCLAFALTVIGILTLGLFSPLATAILALWPLTYHSFFLAVRGATPGMRMLGLQARGWDGQPISLAQAIVLTILFYVTVSLTAWLILLVALFNDRGRTLHDILANTLVVRSPDDAL